MPTQELVNQVLSNTNLVVSGAIYTLENLYDIVESYAQLTPRDYQLESNGDVRWKHAVRSILAKRSTPATKRKISYHGDTKYSFN